MAVASALICAALATAGCGLGPGADVGDVQLTVTRAYGAVRVLDTSVAAKESDTVMRVLEGEADVETRYGGGFVHAIDGVAEGQRGGDPYDWFFYVDGVESQIGAADYDLEGGERIWWDYRNWGATNHAPAVVGSWPAPFSDGIGGEEHPVAVECEGGGVACEGVRQALEREGVKVAAGTPDDAIRVMVGPWARVRQDPVAKLIEAGPAESGVFADFETASLRSATSGVSNRKFDDVPRLMAFGEDGETVEDLGSGTGLVAATSRYGGLPVWVVTGGTAAAVRAAAESLDAEHLRGHYAVAVEGEEATALPLEAR
jgi:hypothetical protein